MANPEPWVSSSWGWILRFRMPLRTVKSVINKCPLLVLKWDPLQHKFLHLYRNSRIAEEHLVLFCCSWCGVQLLLPLTNSEVPSQAKTYHSEIHSWILVKYCRYCWKLAKWWLALSLTNWNNKLPQLFTGTCLYNPLLLAADCKPHSMSLVELFMLQESRVI